MQRIIAKGFKSFGDGYGGLNWILFPRMSDLQAEHEIDLHDMRRYEGGPGQPFARGGIIWHSKSYTLITQRVGLDI